MRYLGGKSRVASAIADVILAHTSERGSYLEPFVGGGTVFGKLAPHFVHASAGDVHPDLVELYTALQRGWTPPDVITEEEYLALRHAEPSAIRGFVGFGCSYGGKFFGGFARDASNGRCYAREAARSLARMIASVSHATFTRCSYEAWTPEAGTVVYCDPPYVGTTGYRVTFDHGPFWRCMDAWHERGAHVYVSEVTAPDHWTCIDEREQTAHLRGDAGIGSKAKRVDRLFARRHR